MTLQQGEGMRLLTDDAAAEYAGTEAVTVRHWAATGLISATETPLGPRYRRDEIDALLADPGLALLPSRWISPGSAASILGVGAVTLSRVADQGRIAVMRAGQGRRYDEREIRLVAAERERLRDPKWWPEPKPTD